MSFLKGLKNYFSRKSKLEKHIIFKHSFNKNSFVFLNTFSPLFLIAYFSIYPSIAFLLFLFFQEKAFNGTLLWLFLLAIFYSLSLMFFLMELAYYSGSFKEFIQQIRYKFQSKYNYSKFLKEKNKALQFLVQIGMSKKEIQQHISELEDNDRFSYSTIISIFNLRNQHKESLNKLKLRTEKDKSENIIHDFFINNVQDNEHEALTSPKEQELVFFEQPENHIQNSLKS